MDTGAPKPAWSEGAGVVWLAREIYPKF